jgi:hypothetical protein
VNQPTTPTTSTGSTPSPAPGLGEEEGSAAPWDVEPAEDPAAAAVSTADLLLVGRHVSTGGYLAGLMAAAELDTAGRADRLPRDLFPEGDPELVQAVWDRACAVAWRAAERYFTARQDPAVLARLRAELEEAGYAAMSGMVARSLSVVRTAGLAHPADGPGEREHGPV